MNVGYRINLASDAYDTNVSFLRSTDSAEPNVLVQRGNDSSINVLTLKDHQTGETWGLHSSSGAAHIVQEKLVSGENIKKIGGRSIVGQGDIPVKTINGVSIFGTGDIPIGAGESSSSAYVTSFTIDELWDAINTVRGNPEASVIIQVNGQDLFEAINARSPILIPRSDYGGYTQVISACIDREGSSYLTIADFNKVIHIECVSDDLLQGNELILYDNYIVVESANSEISPNTIVKRDADGSIGVSAIWDDAGIVWATESSSDEIKGNADYIIPYKRFPQVLGGEEVDIEDLPPFVYYHTGGVLTSLTIRSLYARDMVDEYTIHFFAGEAMELVLPVDVLWANGEIPTIEGNTEYELSLTRYDNGGQNVIKAILVKFS